MLEEEHEYCKQAPAALACAVGHDDRVRRSWTPTHSLKFTYHADCGGQSGTKVDDANAPAGDPWATACLNFDIEGRLLHSTSPAGCDSNVSDYGWGTAVGARATTETRQVVSQGSSQVGAVTTSRQYSLGRLSHEDESPTPAGVTRSTDYAYTGDRPVPDTVTRTGVLDATAAATTSFAYDAWGNLTTRTETGKTRNPGSTANVSYTYITTTLYEAGSNRLLKVAGPAMAGQNWHTEHVYYDGSGTGCDAGGFCAYRLKETINCPAGTGMQGGVCGGSPSFVALHVDSYDEFGHPTKWHEAGGIVVTASYDHFGRVLQATRAGAATVTEYDPAGRLISVTRPLLNGVTNVYDDFDADPDGPRWSRLYSVTRASGSAGVDSERVVYGYDAQGHVTHTTSSKLQAGTPPEVQDAEEIREYSYSLGQRHETIKKNGVAAVVFSYEPTTGALVKKTEDDGINTASVVSYSYKWGAIAEVKRDGVSMMNNTLWTVYGDVLTARDGAGRESTYVYDDLRRLASVATPSAGTTTFGHEPDGAVHERRDADGRSVTYAHDALQRLASEKRGGASEPEVVYTYDATTGRLHDIADLAGTTVFGYDAFGRVSSEARTNGTHAARTTTYGYDTNGNLTSLGYPDGTSLTYPRNTRDPDRAGSVKLGTTFLASAVDWFSGGRLAGLTYGNNATRWDVRAGDGQLESINTNRAGGAALFDLSFTTRDRLGRPTSVAGQRAIWPTASTDTYAYDRFGRLTSGASGSNSTGYRFTDSVSAQTALGNRTQQTWADGSWDAYVYGNGTLWTAGNPQVGGTGNDDRLSWVKHHGCSDTSTCYRYDTSGNLTWMAERGATADAVTTAAEACSNTVTYTSAWCFSYDDWGRLKEISIPSTASSCATVTTTWSYQYDWKGRRVSIVDHRAGATVPAWDHYYDRSDRLLTEVALMPAEVVERSYYYLAGEVLAQRRLAVNGTSVPARFYWHHNDELGTTQVLSNDAGQAVWSASYDPFRLDEVENGLDPYAENPLRFPGQFDDKARGTGVFAYNYHRYYDPGTGRYIQNDPLTMMGVMGLHPYGYAGQNPLVYVDRKGLRFDVVGAGETGGMAAWAFVTSAFDYLRADPGMAAAIDRLERASTTYTITVDEHIGNNEWNSWTNGITWNPHVGARCSDRSGEGMSPALMLAHELAHADGPWYRGALGWIPSGPFDNLEEKRVILGPEHAAARTLGEGMRNDHDGNPFWVPSPTMSQDPLWQRR
ncbi:MAG TPA: RHS repeat-associated core domain-containing protein [Polyangia bacterium]